MPPKTEPKKTWKEVKSQLKQDSKKTTVSIGSVRRYTISL